MRLSRVIGGAALATAMVAIPVTLGSKNGADAGRSGGPGGYAQGEPGNCTACHFFEKELGTGDVTILGAPKRYRTGAVYDLAVRVSDPQQSAAGFEVSVEGSGGHRGDLLISDSAFTQFASQQSDAYLTHKLQGYNDSAANWAANGGAYTYHFQWQAPAVDVGSVTLFAAGNAVNFDNGIEGDRYYESHATMQYGVPGDADGDTDIDLEDLADYVACLEGPASPRPPGCELLDVDGDGDVDVGDFGEMQAAFSGATAMLPAGYVLADVVRGGLLYDRWWTVNGTPVPTGDHPLYPGDDPDPLIGQQSGSVTFRCKECHGWDYKGRDGAYATGSHRTDIAGVLGTTLTPQEIFDLLTATPSQETPNGHDMDAYGMSDEDLWDVVKFTLEGVVDTNDFILPIPGQPFFFPIVTDGAAAYDTYCASCHDDGADFGRRGTNLNFGSELQPAYIDTVARTNPYEFLHKMRFGHPGASMPKLHLLGVTDQTLRDLGGFCSNECAMGVDDCLDGEVCEDRAGGFVCTMP